MASYSGSMKQLQSLEAWRVARRMASTSYRLTLDTRLRTHMALSDQIRRAAISVPANIAEGYALGTTSQWIRMNRVALGSAVELRTHLELLRDLELVDPGEVDRVLADTTQVVRLLVGLLKRLGARTPEANNNLSPPGSV